MAREIPEVVRAAAGLAATVLDEARKLPETLPGLPVRLIGLAMQQAMKVQQQYAGFVARGDELFTGLRGEDEPGLATFDDELDDLPPAAPTGYRESAFDRAADTEPTSADAGLVVDEDIVAREAPDTEAILDEIAIDELVDQAPTLAETAPAGPAPTKRAKPATPAKAEPATVAKPTPPAKAEPATVASAPATDTPTADAPATDAPAATAPPADSAAAGAAPVDGYDAFTVAQLRGRLRGYALSTVQELVTYEQATLARAPYLTMLRNRLEKLEEQAVESSPLAPRSA
jgi:hypothetical protein